MTSLDPHQAILQELRAVRDAIETLATVQTEMVQAIAGHTAIVTEQIVQLRLVERDIAALRKTRNNGTLP
jgi:hypothetical protein